MASPHHFQQLATTALYFTYSALEEEMDSNKDHPAFAPLYFPMELHRKEALTKDMEYFFGEDWKKQVKCSEATRKYVERIHYVGQHEPELLVAHAYTRYMGDLSGGQVLKKVAQRALKLPSTGEGTQFYLFENVNNAQQFKQFYRARMNALDLNPKTKEKIVEEANKAFEYNMQVLWEARQEGASDSMSQSRAAPNRHLCIRTDELQLARNLRDQIGHREHEASDGSALFDKQPMCPVLRKARPQHEVGFGGMELYPLSHYRILVLRNGVLPF